MKQSQAEHRTSNLRTHSLILLGYLALGLWLTWPAPLHLSDTYFTHGNTIFFLPGTPDAAQNIWNFWWGRHALATGQNPFYSSLLYYPQGVQMLIQTINIVAIILTLPLNWLFGPTAAYNISAILGISLTGYFGFLLVRTFTNGTASPFLAGALITACPFHIAKLDIGQLNFVSMQWLLLFCLSVVHLIGATDREQKVGQAHIHWPAILCSTLAFLLVLFTDWYWTIVAVALGGTWMLLGFVGSAHPWQQIKNYLAFGLLTAMSCAPVIMVLLTNRTSTSGGNNEIWALYTQGYSADALGLFFPAALNPLWSEAAERFLVSVAPYGIIEGSYTATGWVLATLGLSGAWWYRRTHWKLIIMGSVGWFFSVGPTLYLLGHNTGLPMPYRLIQAVPLLSTARRPNLFGIITLIVLMIFAGLALRKLQTTLAQRRFTLVYLGLALLACIELWPPIRTAYTMERPAVFTHIAAAPGVVLDLPIENDTSTLSSRTLLNQMVHQQPILRGYVARPPDDPTLTYNPLVRRLAWMIPWPDRDIIALDTATLAQMQCYYRFRYVVVEKALLSAEQQTKLKTTLQILIQSPPTAWYEDPRFTAYELPIDTEACQPFAYLGAGWHGIEQDTDRTWRWTKGYSQIYVVNPSDTARTLDLDFSAEAHTAGQRLTISSGTTSLSLRMNRALRRYRVSIPTTPGLNLIELRSDTYEVRPGYQMGISVQRIVVH